MTSQSDKTCYNDGNCYKPECPYIHLKLRGECRNSGTCQDVRCPLRHSVGFLPLRGRGQARGAHVPRGSPVSTRGYASPKYTHLRTESSSSSSSQDWSTPAKAKKTERVPKSPAAPIDVDAILCSFAGTVSLGAKINRISIRVVTPALIRCTSPGDEIESKAEGDPVCYLFYKENDKPRPTIHFFPYTDAVRAQIEIIINNIRIANKYTMTTPENLQYTWFYKGHVLDTYDDIKTMFFSAFRDGKLQMKKDDYMKQEWYNLLYHVDHKAFKAYYLYENYQFINKELEAKKAPSEPAPTAGDCVICKDDIANYTLTPCGHMCLCQLCSAHVPSGALKFCPICRLSIDNVFRIYAAC